MSPVTHFKMCYLYFSATKPPSFSFIRVHKPWSIQSNRTIIIGSSKVGRKKTTTEIKCMPNTYAQFYSTRSPHTSKQNDDDNNNIINTFQSNKYAVNLIEPKTYLPINFVGYNLLGWWERIQARHLFRKKRRKRRGRIRHGIALIKKFLMNFV